MSSGRVRVKRIMRVRVVCKHGGSGGENARVVAWRTMRETKNDALASLPGPFRHSGLFRVAGATGPTKTDIPDTQRRGPVLAIVKSGGAIFISLDVS